jgi:hypothetical protein
MCRCAADCRGSRRSRSRRRDEWWVIANSYSQLAAIAACCGGRRGGFGRQRRLVRDRPRDSTVSLAAAPATTRFSSLWVLGPLHSLPVGYPHPHLLAWHRVLLDYCEFPPRKRRASRGALRRGDEQAGRDGGVRRHATCPPAVRANAGCVCSPLTLRRDGPISPPLLRTRRPEPTPGPLRGMALPFQVALPRGLHSIYGSTRE